MTNLRSLRETLNPTIRGALFYLGFFLCAGVFFPFLNVYFMKLGFSGRQIGLLSALSPLITLIFATPLSALADHKRWRVRIIQWAIAGAALLLFTLKFPSTYGWIVLLLTLMAIFFSPVMSIADSLIASMATRHRLNYGNMRLWGSVGFAASATIFGALWQRVGLEPMFVTGSLLLIPLSLVAGLLEEGPVTGEHTRQPISIIGRDLGLVVILAATFLVGISTSLTLTFEGIYVHYLGGGNLLVGAMMGVSAMSEIPMMRYGQQIAKRFNAPNTLLLAYGLMGCAYLGYVLVRLPWMLVPLAMLKGLGFGLFFANTVRIVNERAPVDWITTVQSLMTAGMFGLAPLIAAPLGGVIYDEVGPPAIFVGGFLALGLAATVLGVAKSKGILD